MYVAARGWGIQPSEFWGMTMAEWFVEADHHTGHQKPVRGHLSPDEFDRLSALLEPE
mgnify:CR=1 FL=1